MSQLNAVLIQDLPRIEHHPYRPSSSFEHYQGLIPRITKMPGDTSVRSYYRIEWEGMSAIAMKLATEPFKTTESTNQKQKINEPDFINMARCFSAVGVPVPTIYHHNPAEGIIYLEDLGDLVLYDVFQKEGESKRVENLYKSAINSLVKIQCIQQSKDVVGFMRGFDPALYKWELNHFLQYALKDHDNISLSEEQEKQLEQEFNVISVELRSPVYCLAHRDFHSKNMMITHDTNGNENVTLIDFQDALRAPIPYDLASFLRDAYTPMSVEFESAIFSYYIEQMTQHSRAAVEPTDAYRFWFEMVALERNLKAIGRFFYFDKEYGKKTHLPFVPLLMQKALRAICALDRFPVLRSILESNMENVCANAAK